MSQLKSPQGKREQLDTKRLSDSHQMIPIKNQLSTNESPQPSTKSSDNKRLAMRDTLRKLKELREMRKRTTANRLVNMLKSLKRNSKEDAPKKDK